ncbi:MAG: hypothetical protein Q7T18_07650 [Sedimentisphaerales bacterium]|nr:hypothetical protein [Sedimentisphaerales bacterium]
MQTVLIGIDDTDNETSPGTGSLARKVSAECEKRGMHPCGVTRHQFLLDPAIPYTSHNSGACVVIEGDNAWEIAQFAFEFVAGLAAEGSDPGVCLAKPEMINDDVVAFSQDATNKVLCMQPALDLAKKQSILLQGLGGTSQGVIGALASVGLRHWGNEGRFIDMPGLRQMPRHVTIQEFKRLGIAVEHKPNGRIPTSSDVYDTLDWVRPRLENAKPVLLVEWSSDKNVWIPVDRKKSRPLE